MIDLGQIAGGGPLDADVAIVGAGPAGLAVALELAGTALKVVILESGGRGAEADTAALSAGLGSSLPNDGMRSGRWRGLGGTTRLWAGQCVRMDAGDFVKRAWVPGSGWPFGASELDPYYRRAERHFMLGDVAYDKPIGTRSGGEPLDFSPFGLVPRSTVYTPELNFYDAHKAALRSAANLHLVTHATVAGIVPDPDMSRIAHLIVRDLAGHAVRVTARAVVLCAGAIENARLLLVSNDRAPAGIGNQHDMVGRYFQDHPSGRVGRIVTRSPERIRSLFARFRRKRLWYFPKLRLADEAQERRQVLSAILHPEYDYAELEALRRIKALARGGHRRELLRAALPLLPRLPALAREGIRWGIIRQAPRLPISEVHLRVYGEQAPDPESRVTLAAERDALGVSEARVSWRLSDLDRRTFAVATQAAGDAFRSLGLGEIEPSGWMKRGELIGADRVVDTYHHAGTTRMGENPRSSVVDPHCQVHGMAGLYIAGGSVFPIAGYANPTLTIVALAIRLADRLRAVLSR